MHRHQVMHSPSNTWWLLRSSVWRPPHSRFSLCRVALSSCWATSAKARLPEERIMNLDQAAPPSPTEPSPPRST